MGGDTADVVMSGHDGHASGFDSGLERGKDIVAYRAFGNVGRSMVDAACRGTTSAEMLD